MKYLLPLLMMISVNCFGQHTMKDSATGYIDKKACDSLFRLLPIVDTRNKNRVDTISGSGWLNDSVLVPKRISQPYVDSLFNRIDSLQSLCDSLTSRNDKLIKIIADLIEVEAVRLRRLDGINLKKGWYRREGEQLIGKLGELDSYPIKL